MRGEMMAWTVTRRAWRENECPQLSLSRMKRLEILKSSRRCVRCWNWWEVWGITHKCMWVSEWVSEWVREREREREREYILQKCEGTQTKGHTAGGQKKYSTFITAVRVGMRRKNDNELYWPGMFTHIKGIYGNTLLVGVCLRLTWHLHNNGMTHVMNMKEVLCMFMTTVIKCNLLSYVIF